MWEIEYWEEGKRGFLKWLDNLDKEKEKALKRKMTHLGIYGNKVGLPHSRSLGGRLYELREKKYGLRVYYTFRSGRVILLFIGGDKGTQRRDIKKARRYLAQLSLETEVLS